MNIWLYCLSAPESRQFQRLLAPLGRQGFCIHQLDGPDMVQNLFNEHVLSEHVFTEQVFTVHDTPSSPDLLISGSGNTFEALRLLETLRLRAPVDFLPLLRHPSAYELSCCLQTGPIDLLLSPCSDRRLLQALRRFINMRAELSAWPDHPDQADLDRLLSGTLSHPAPGASGKTRLSRSAQLSGADLSLPLLDNLTEIFMLSRTRMDGITASDAAERMQISRVTARAYLELLFQEGYLKKETRSQCRPGRPSVYYMPVREYFL